jgi:hypothetical protein
VHEWYPDVGGLAYRSRLDDVEWCWALWDDTPVVVDVRPFTPSQHAHRRAAQHAAARLQILLPDDWL